MGDRSEYPACQPGYEYEQTSSKKYIKTEFKHYHRNTASTSDRVTYAVKITKSSTANVKLSGTFDLMVAEAGVSVMVSFGVAESRQVKMSWKIPSNSYVKLTAGTSWVSVTGVERYINGRCKYTFFPSRQKENGLTLRRAVSLV